jgi:hypothetical protein
MATYSTSDLYLSAFLKSRGMRLIDKKKEGNKFYFIFEDRAERKELINEYLNDGSVNITAFKNAIQDIKTMMFNV